VKDKKFNNKKTDSFKKADGFRKNDNFKKHDYYSNEPKEEKEDNGVVIGRNAVRELLKSERSVDKIYVRKGDREGSITVLIAEASNKNIPIIEVEQQKLDNLAEGANHQGIVALAAMKEYSTVDDMLALANEREEKPLIVICDSIEDPHNLGAIIRCAECAGAHGIIIPKRRSVGITPTVYKSSAGAIEHMLIAKVANLNTTVEELKEKGLWIFAAEAGGEPYYETDFNCGCGIILGSEGNGVSRILKENSDYIVSIPMYGKVNSLNVSTAASVILCHVARIQRG
jgi:23S rRNA (guanosine2251-2'-O)-methyltransferase